jgi:hypothetical protein
VRSSTCGHGIGRLRPCTSSSTWSLQMYS